MLMPRYMGLNDSSSSSGNRGPTATITSSSSNSSLGSPPTTVAAHTKMRLLSKVEHNMRQSQGQSGQDINSLLHTASSGNGVVGDVDGLLTPMRIKAHVSPPPSSSSMSGSSSGKCDSSLQGSTRPERNLWSRAEMLEMLNIMQEMNALEQLNDRNLKSENVFRQIEEVMRSKGYVKKSGIQIWTKWKFLKSTYNTTTRHGTGIPKVVPEEVYRVLCRMLSGERRSGSNSNNISASLSEGGNSMDSSRTQGEDPKEDILGVEHPIFGFRLGPIKPEPVDTGYENPSKSDMVSEPDMDAFDYEAEGNGDGTQAGHQDQEEVPHLPFIVSVKHEPDMDLGMDETNTPPPTAPASPSPPPAELEDDADGDPVYTSTPMPPLRVASFAKDDHNRPSHGILQIDRPPPTLTKMGRVASPSRMSRSLPLQNTNNINFVHPTSKLMLPRKQNSNQSGMRLPRDISVQPSGMRMKTVPMRETGYPHRSERMISDLEQPMTSPPHSPTILQTHLNRGPPPKYPTHSQHMGPSTSRQAHTMSTHQLTPHQHQQLQTRKRRMGQSPTMGMPVPVKLQRSSTMYDSNPKGPRANAPPVSDEGKRKTSEEDSKRRKKHHEELFAKELTHFANAMRVAQKEMLVDFFKQQKEFARREHDFQMKQDTMVMRALRKQTNLLLKTAKDLVGGDTKALDTKLEAKEESIPETHMSFEPETQLETRRTDHIEIRDEILDAHAEEDGDEIMVDPQYIDDDEDDDDGEGEEDDNDEEEEDGENLVDDFDPEMSPLALSASALSEDYSNQVDGHENH